MRCLLAVFTLCAVPAIAAAETPQARFQLEPVSGGVIRLDRETGAVELCRGDTNIGYRCETVVQGVGLAEEAQIEALRLERDALQAELSVLRSTLERIAELAGPAPESNETSEPLITSTTRQEIDRALQVTDTALRTFRDLFRGLQDTPSDQ